MNKILLIWHGDSDLIVYLLHVDKERFEKIKRCHEKYININEDEELLWFDKWLNDKDTDIIFQVGQSGKFNFPIIPDNTTLVVCGSVD